ncbi:MAG: hypothetical protein ABW321_07475 [Polyangiales bacterium]
MSCERAGGRNFLKTRTSIDVTDGPICGASVVDPEECRPGDFGGGHWEKDTDFPPFTVSEGSRRGDAQRVASEVRQYYLGSPFYDGDVHPYCKRGITSGFFRPDTSDIFPPDSTTLQEYNLATIIDDRAVKPLTTRLHTALKTRDEDRASGITARFYERLNEEVRDRVQARIIWFVARYPGGVSDMARNEHLRRCLQEARDNDAPVVTGVAGYLVLDNRIDNSIASEDVFLRALDRATAGYDELNIEGGLKHDLANEWGDRVSDIANIKMARQDLTATAWPLYVQLQ